MKLIKNQHGWQAFSLMGALTVITVVIATGSIMWFQQSVNEDRNVVAETQVITKLANVTVYKSATCNCCNKWGKHLESEGFKIVAHNEHNMNAIKTSLGVKLGLASCHTATVGGYVIEGHVPAKDIIRLLTEKPEGVIGLTAPRMPQFSPGMQSSGLEPRGYDVLMFDKEGNTQLFTSY